MEKVLKVQIWSDLICPWCWIGERRFARALEAFPYREQVQVEMRAFRLMPGVVPERVEDMLAKKMGPRVNPRDMFAQIQQVAAQDGLTYRLAGTFAGDTLDAHRVVKLAHQFGLQEPVLEKLHEGYFTHHANLFDRSTLTELGVEAGLDARALASLFEGNQFTDAVLNEQAEAEQRGIRGLPYFLFGEKTSLSGGQPINAFADVLARAWEREGFSPDSSTTIPVCGPEGCALP